MVEELSPAQGQNRVAAGALLLDVREADEYQEIHAQGAHLLPLSELESRFAELDKERELVVICRSGARSLRAAEFLQGHGYRAANLSGGTKAWAADGLPTETGAQA